MSMPGLAILLPALALAVAALWRGRRMIRESWPATAAEFLAPILLGLVAFCYVNTLLLSTRWGWSACRLAPTLGLVHGYPLYSPAASGPINGWVYGPVAPLAWLPAALAGSPLPALSIAAAIDLVLLLLPLFLASIRFTAGSGPPRLLAFVFGAAGLLLVYPTWYMASALTADAVAVGLGGASCLALLGAQPPGNRRLILAAALCTLASWTKQVDAPLGVALVAWLWIARGRGPALRFGAFYAAAMLAFAALACAAVVPRDMLFNLWTIPAAHATRGGLPVAWLEFTYFFGYTALFWVPCAMAIPLLARVRRAGELGPLMAMMLPLLVAAAMLPLGIRATIKIASDRNSIHSVYYLALGTTIALGCAWSGGVLRAWARQAAVALTSAAVACAAARVVASYPSMPMLPARCLSQEAWTAARQQPGRFYFPWDPLATLMAEGKLYPFEYGVRDRIWAGVPPSAAQVRGNLPAHMTEVVYPRTDSPQVILKQYLPEFTFSAATADWLIFRRAAPK